MKRISLVSLSFINFCFNSPWNNKQLLSLLKIVSILIICLFVDYSCISTKKYAAIACPEFSVNNKKVTSKPERQENRKFIFTRAENKIGNIRDERTNLFKKIQDRS
ncbi:MAG TPA: hypothetical protein VIK14_13020, partial [Ignavibacteria bacterium]